MQLGKSLIGAVLGGVLGIALLVLIHFAAHLDDYWLAIPVAILTGMGVRWVVSTKGHPSYARGAITGILAILAFMAGNYLVAEVATRQSAKTAAAPVVIPGAGQEGDEQATEPAEAAPAVVEPARQTEIAPGAGGMRNARPQQSSPWDYFWLGIAALIAYELGRGSGGAPAPAVTTVPEGDVPPPAGA